MLTDTERSNELGLPLVRGPFATLGEARHALTALRSGPTPVSDLAERIAAIPKRDPAVERGRPTPRRARGGTPVVAAPLPVVIREFRSRDGEDLRALWQSLGFTAIDDDDMSLRRFAQRNPGLFLVAAQGSTVVGSAMGGWDGRRGWIYHVATAPGHRRGGLATKLVRQVEAGLRGLGCRKVNVIVRDDNDDGAVFWTAIGYRVHEARQFGRELPEDPETEG